MARRTSYDAKYCKEIIKFFNVEPHFETPCITTYKDGSTKEEVKLIPSDLPLFSAFAISINKDRTTIFRWAKKHKEFRNALKRAKECQRKILITNGLQGLYSTPFAIFTAKNVIGWRDKTETDLTTNGKDLASVCGLLPEVIDNLNRYDNLAGRVEEAIGGQGVEINPPLQDKGQTGELSNIPSELNTNPTP
jgi:hypothetical protein